MKEDRNLAAEFIEACAEAVGSRKEAVAAVRALCKWFGGQPLYIPLIRANGVAAEAIRGVLADAVGDLAAERMLQKIMTLFGGVRLYIPMEARAFRDAIAREIYEKYDGSQESLRKLCREYNMSFVQVYRMFSEGRDSAKQLTFNFEE